MFRRRATFRLYFLGALTLLALAVVTAKLWYVQILKGDEYRMRLNLRSQVTVRIPAVRGEICDRNGIPLVQNRPSFDVDFYLPSTVRAYKQINGRVPQTTYRATVYNMAKDLSEDDVVTVVKESIIPRLEDLGLAQDFNARKLQLHYRHNVEVPFRYRRDLDFDTMARFSENNLLLPGVTVSMNPVRYYVYGALAAHLLGYVGVPREINREEAAKFTYYQPDMEGKSQIELYANNWLKGTPGVRTLQRNVKGATEGEVAFTPPKVGDNVHLTIDARIQYIAEKALRSVTRAAAVVVNPNNGDILAMASVPSFDPNKFIPVISGKDWANLIKDTTDPLTNRALGAYAPGSTYKIVTSLAGLHAGIGQKKFTCTGGVQYGNKYMQCWVTQKHMKPHGTLNLVDALKVSCNAFFYQYGNAAGIEQIDTVGNMLGLGQKSGVPLSGESAGILPSPEWLKKISPTERWSGGYTANVSIGQGFVLASPLQMALVTAAVANGGTAYYPRLIDRIVSPDGHLVFQEPPKVRSNLLEDGKITENDFQLVRKGMWSVVNASGGSGSRARISGAVVAGKTGTAQFWRSGVKDNRVWFVAFAPFDKPKYAVCVMVEGAKSGGGVAAPIVGNILQNIINMENGQVPKLTVLPPASGSFSQVDSVSYAQNVAVTRNTDPENNEIVDEETADTAAPPDSRAVERRQEPSPRPDVSDEADAAGRVRNRPKNKPGFGKLFDFLQRQPKKSNP
ncbi:MAG: penicillin-binding protein 2 [Verrucomicrobia bacterium]|nr:MAG: penicillin-binding protein 2 [Verrucomicrobiota bacterium]